MKQSPSTPGSFSPANHDVALAQGAPEGDEHFSRPDSSYREWGLPHTAESGHPKFSNDGFEGGKIIERKV